MKYNLENKTNRFAQRTLRDFREALIGLCTKKNFEKITVQELCDTCNYPRATFYNYFDDIYGLLDYCFSICAKEMNLSKVEYSNPQELPFILFEQTYNYLEDREETIRLIYRNNPLDGKMLASFQLYMRGNIADIIKECPCTEASLVPYEIIAEHYSNTVFLILEYGFIKKRFKDKQEATKLLRFLLEDFQLKLVSKEL